MTKTVKPILSICIPTFNRSARLEILLENLVRESSDCLERIEIVVSDNGSEDATADVVKSSSLPIKYVRQECNRGFACNMIFATTELATGEFVWIIGDDDLVLPGGVARVLKSIHDAPDVDYHYLNFGWIDVNLRAQIVQEKDGHPPATFLERLQYLETGWKRLQRLEDLVFLPTENVSATFSGIFCFITRRQFFLDAIGSLHPSINPDGSSLLIDDCFPHAMITLPRVAGKPIAYVGSACLMQGVNGWEWEAYASKIMIFGTHQFFEWLTQTTFAKDAMQHLWESYYQMTGKLFFRMLYYGEEHKGVDIVMRTAIPSSAGHMDFWDAFMGESRLHLDTDHDARNLSEWVTQLLAKNPDARIGLWGVYGRGHRFVRLSPHLHNNLVWVTDRNTDLHDTPLDGTELRIASPETLRDADLDVLVIGARREFVAGIASTALPLLKAGAAIISVDGTMAARS